MEVATLCALTAGTYTYADVLEMEKSVLRVLQFDLSIPVPCFFLQRLLTVHQDDVQVRRCSVKLLPDSEPLPHLA